LWETSPLVHTQHVYVLPSAIAFVVGPYIDYSFRPFAFLAAGLLIALGLAFYRLARAGGLGPLEAVGVFVAVASFRHYENLLLGFQFGLVLCVLLGVLAVQVAAARRDRLGFLLAAALALGSMASSSAGLMAGVVVCIVRFHDGGGRRRWILAGIAAAALVAAVHFGLLWSTGYSYVSDVLRGIGSLSLPRILVDVLRLAGGGVVGGSAAEPVGLLVLAAGSARIARQLRSGLRFDAASGLALFGLLATLAVAIARTPIDVPASRHAVFVAPLVGTVAFDLLRFLRSLSVARAMAHATWIVALAWTQSLARLDAGAYRNEIVPWDLDARFAMACAGDQVLGAEEIGRVNNGDPEFIRSLMEYTRYKRWSIFAPGYDGLVEHHGLPTHCRGRPWEPNEEGALESRGQTCAYEPLVCSFEQGCTAQVFVDATVQGQATLGFIVRDPQGLEKSNVGQPLCPGAGSCVQSMRVEASRGDTLEPYVFAFARKDVVQLRRFVAVLAQGTR
jgi:hypothetical protein